VSHYELCIYAPQMVTSSTKSIFIPEASQRREILASPSEHSLQMPHRQKRSMHGPEDLQFSYKLHPKFYQIAQKEHTDTFSSLQNVSNLVVHQSALI